MNKNSLPKHWQKTEFKNCIEQISIKNKIKTKDYKKNGKYPIIDQGQNFISGYCDEANFLITINKPVIIFGDHTRCFKFVNFDFIAGADGIKILKPKNNFIPKLFYYFCLALNFPNKGYSRHWQYLAKTIINIPTIAEQREIVSEIERRFEKLDKAIENFRQILKNLKLYRQSVLKFAFDGKFTNPNLTNWQTKPLGEVAITSSGGTPSRKNKYFWENGEINWLKSGELNDDFINFTEEKITQEAINKSSAKILPKGTLLIAMYGATIGKLGILNLETSTNQAICAIQNKKEILFEVKFLFYFLLFNRKKMINEAFGGAQKNISQMYLKNLQIPLPPLSEQKQIVSEIEKRFAKADKIENLINKSLKNAEILKQSILKQAFSGNLKVKNERK